MGYCFESAIRETKARHENHPTGHEKRYGFRIVCLKMNLENYIIIVTLRV